MWSEIPGGLQKGQTTAIVTGIVSIAFGVRPLLQRVLWQSCLPCTCCAQQGRALPFSRTAAKPGSAFSQRFLGVHALSHTCFAQGATWGCAHAGSILGTGAAYGLAGRPTTSAAARSLRLVVPAAAQRQAAAERRTQACIEGRRARCFSKDAEHFVTRSRRTRAAVHALGNAPHFKNAQ